MVNHSDVHTFIYFELASSVGFSVSALDLKDVTVLPEGVFSVEIPKAFRFNDLI